MGNVDMVDASTNQHNHLKLDHSLSKADSGSPRVCLTAVETEIAIPTSPSANGTNTSSLTPLSSMSPRQGSPIPSSNGSSKELPKQANPTTVARNGPPPAKKRKLTLAEKDERLREQQERKKEKEAKEVERVERKAKLDQEKRARDEEREEERRRKEIEREQKRQAKEAEKQAKDEEKRKKEEDRQRKDDEKERKDKAQLRLNAFFKAPAPAKSSATAPAELVSSASTREGACELKALEDESLIKTITTTSYQDKSSDYSTNFQPFFAKDDVQVASQHRFGKEAQGMELVREKIDNSIQESRRAHREDVQRSDKLNIPVLCNIPPHRQGVRERQHITTKEIIARMNASGQEVVDLTRTQDQSSSRKPSDLLHGITMKYLRFREDVRPPYMGTFTKKPSGTSARTLCRNPFKRSIPQLNYDYDSEVEWEEPDPEDGEDLGSEDEEAGSEGDEDEMEGFLDDEETFGNSAASNKRRLVVGDLKPVCTGLCWEDHRGRSQCNQSGESLTKIDMSGYKIEIMKDTVDIPIDPYASSYWENTTGPLAVRGAPGKRESSSMNPPRIPLHVINRTNAGMNSSITPSQANPISDGKATGTNGSIANLSEVAKPIKRSFPAEHMAAFRMAIQGSELTKAGLVEVLKKKFPKVSKDIIKESLSSVAHRVGAKESEKVWSLLDGA